MIVFAVCLVSHSHTPTQTCVSFMQESGFCWNSGSHTCIGILSLPRCWSTVPRQPPPWPWQNLSGCGYTSVHVAPSMHPTVPKSGFQLLTLVAVGTRHKISLSHKSRSVLNTTLIFRQHSKCTCLIREAGHSFSLCIAYLRFFREWTLLDKEPFLFKDKVFFFLVPEIDRITFKFDWRLANTAYGLAGSCLFGSSHGSFRS